MDAQGGSGQTDVSASCRRGFFFCLAVFGTLLIATLCSQLPAGLAPAWLAHGETTTRALWPQRWYLFADQAESPVLTVYAVGTDGSAEPLLLPQMSVEGRWGLGRRSLSVFEEAGYLAEHVPSTGWTICAGDEPWQCASVAHTVSMNDGFDPPELCGSVLFIRSEPEAEGSTARPSAVKVSLTCAE
jgi:hypothetical protein